MPSKNSHRSPIKKEILLDETGEFQIIYEQYYLAVFRFIFGIHGGPIEDVEDLTINTFLRAWKSRHRFQGSIDAVLGWLLRIARNLVIDQFRSQKNKFISIELETQYLPSHNLSPEEKLNQNEQTKILCGLLSNISAEHREIIVLRYFLGWRVKAIAEHLGEKENTISVKIKRILKRIQDEWPEE